MDTLYGFPILRPDEVFPWLTKQGVGPREISVGPKSIESYIANGLTPKQEKAMHFAPTGMAMEFADDPGNPFFYTLGKPWSNVFIPIPLGEGRWEYVVLVGEYKHGQHQNTAGGVMVTLPGGGWEKGDSDQLTPESFADKAKYEVREETGLNLARLVPLSKHPHAVSGRNNSEVCMSFIGFAKTPIVPGPLQHEKTEIMRPFLMKITDWLEMISRGDGIQNACADTTLLALNYMNKINA